MQGEAGTCPRSQSSESVAGWECDSVVTDCSWLPPCPCSFLPLSSSPTPHRHLSPLPVSPQSQMLAGVGVAEGEVSSRRSVSCQV